MEHLEKGLYENCRKYDFGKLVAKELEKRGIMISDNSLLYELVEKAEKEKIKVYIVDRKSIPDIIRCGLIDNNLLEAPKSEENVQEYVEKVIRTCIERYLGECGEYVKNTTLDILTRDMMVPFIYHLITSNNVKVPDLDALTSFFTYSFLVGTGNRKNNIIIVYLDKETLDQLLLLLFHEEFHLMYDPSSGKYLDSKLYSKILEPYINSNPGLKSEVEIIGIVRGEEIAAEYVSLLTLKELGDESTELINIRKKFIEDTLSKITEKIKIIGEGSISFYLRCYRTCPLRSYLLAYKLLEDREIKEKVIEFLRKYL